MRIATLVDHARRDGVALLVLPDAALGGYLDDIADPIRRRCRRPWTRRGPSWRRWPRSRGRWSSASAPVSSNLTGTSGGTRFLGQAKAVGPDGEILARTWSNAGIAVAELDVLSSVRRVLAHLEERRPDVYR